MENPLHKLFQDLKNRTATRLTPLDLPPRWCIHNHKRYTHTLGQAALAPLVQPGGRGRCDQGSPGSPPWGERRGAEILAAKTRNCKEIW